MKGGVVVRNDSGIECLNHAIGWSKHSTDKTLVRKREQGNAFVNRILEKPKVWIIGTEHDLAV